MHKIFYFFLDSPLRRSVLGGAPASGSARHMLYGADQLLARGFEVHHNLEEEPSHSRLLALAARLIDGAIRRLGGSSGNFLAVLQARRRCRTAELVVSTADNVGVPLAFLNYFGLLRRPLLYVSIGLPERIAGVKSPLVRAFYRRLYRRIPRFVAYGWSEAAWIRTWLGLPADSDRVVFLPFGVALDLFCPDPAAVATTDVLSIGADFHRDFQLLLVAAARLPELSFRIITSSHHAATFRSVPPNVTLLTDVPFSEVRGHLAAARIVAIPCHENTYSGGTTTLLQAMSMARAVVVSRTGAIREGYHLRDRANCRLVPPGSLDALEQALRELAHDPDTRARLGAAARRTVETHLSWSGYVDRLATLLREQIGRENG